LKKVIISVTNDLVSDQRVDKVANSLINNNFTVILIGRKLKDSLSIKRNYNTRRFRLLFTKGPFFYAEYNIRLFIFLIFCKADIFLSNDLDTLAANFFASKIRKKPLVYDSHEYFTEVPELVNRKKVQRIWQNIEKLILPSVKNSYTVCQSIADIYNNKYKINMKIVRNLPVCTDSEIKIAKTENRKIIVYQGALNIGRGIEFIIEAMQFIDNAVFWIIGDGDIKSELEELTKNLNMTNKVTFFGKIPFEKLKSITLQCDLGVSIEENLGLNYYYSLPNKIFDYINSCVPILASPFPEMKNIIEKFNIGELIIEHNVKHIASKINEILNNEEKNRIWKRNLELAKNELCWQKEEFALINIFKNIT
jgi:glycosyltransferase involved in cell wall biosynthesis